MRDDETPPRPSGSNPVWTLQVANLPTASIIPAGQVTNMAEETAAENNSIFKTLYIEYSTAEDTDEIHELDIDNTIDLRVFPISMLDASICEPDEGRWP